MVRRPADDERISCRARECCCGITAVLRGHDQTTSSSEAYRSAVRHTEIRLAGHQASLQRSNGPDASKADHMAGLCNAGPKKMRLSSTPVYRLGRKVGESEHGGRLPEPVWIPTSPATPGPCCRDSFANVLPKLRLRRRDEAVASERSSICICKSSKPGERHRRSVLYM